MGSLDTKRILIVDDDATIAMLLEEMVLDEGGVVVGPARRLDAALALAQDERLDAAILDVNLGGTPSYPVADVLRQRGVPFIFATGYGDGAAPGIHADAPVIGKPFSLDALVARIAALM